MRVEMLMGDGTAQGFPSQNVPTLIEVSVPDPVTKVIEVAVPTLEAQVIEVVTPGPQGPPAALVAPTDPALTVPGLWIQTGLGDDGTGFTFWIEDGQ